VVNQKQALNLYLRKCHVVQNTRESYLKFQEETTLKIADDELAKWADIVENMY
jgi:hypothetical protein